MPSKIDTFSKASLDRSVAELVTREFTPRISKPPEGYPFGYIVELQQKWRGNTLTLSSLYQCDGPNALHKNYEAKYTKITWEGTNSYSLSFMRHTEKWHKVYSGLSLAETLKAIESEQTFHPSL